MSTNSPQHHLLSWPIRSVALGGALVVLLACGTLTLTRQPPPPYNSTFGSSGACQSAAEPDHSATNTLATVLSVGPNTTICLLDPGNGLLEQHHDVAVHGDVVGYADGLLFIHQRGGADGHGIALCAVTLLDGRQRWCQPGIETPAMDPFFAGIWSENGLLYLPLGYVPARFSSPPTTTASATTPTPTPTPTPLPQRSTMLYALSESDGQIVWSVPIPDLVRSFQTGFMLAVGQGMVYLGLQEADSSHTRICAWQATTGTQAWCAPLTQPYVEDLSVADGQLYVRASNTGNTAQADSAIDVYALDATTGTQRWDTSLPGLTGIFHPVLVATRGTVYTNIPRCHCDDAHPSQDASEELFALRASTGAQVWSTVIAKSVWTIAPTETVLYVGSQLSGGITAVRISDGASLWHERLPPNLSVCCDDIDTIVPSSQTLYVSIPEGFSGGADLLAVNRDTGHTLWQDDGCTSGTAPAGSRCYCPRIAQRGCVRSKAAPGRRLFPPGEKVVRDHSVLAAGVGTRLGEAFLALRTAPSDLSCACVWLEPRNADRF